MLTIYNSLTRKQELFKPIVPGKIGIYVCGITVYDRCHLGHARTMVCFDAIVRYLRSQGYAVTYVRNITDIDDKIIARAHQANIPIEVLTSRYIAAMHEDNGALNILPPDLEPRATSHIEVIKSLIQKLLDLNYAYVSANGDVCYEVSKFNTYGQLAHKDIAGLMAGARVDVVSEKRSPLDFVLWKKAKVGEPSWPSLWGDGRPGWHIECSAMSMHELGEQFDIHGGGLDLQFPHHENEIAQSEGVTGKALANYWIHIGLLQINNEKMAKSTGNFAPLGEMLKNYHPEVLRYFLLSSHYRSSLNYSSENLQNASKGLMRLYQALKNIADIDLKQAVAIDETWTQQFNAAMNDDFNTPAAFSVLFQLSHEINRTKSPKLAATLKQLGGILGLLQCSPEEFLQSDLGELSKEEIERLIEERIKARTVRDWSQADAIRQRLADAGIELEDGAEGTAWRKRV